VSTDRLPSKTAGGPIPDFGWKKYLDGDVDPVQAFIENLLQQIKDTTGIDLFWLLDWSWTTNTLLELVSQSNDLFSWLQNPLQRPPNLLSRPGFSSPSAIVEAPDWSWDPVVSLGTIDGPSGISVTDPQGSARTIADGLRHALMSNAISDKAALTPGQILVCQVHVLVEDGFTAANDQAIRLEIVPSRYGLLQEPVVLAHCGVPTDSPDDWIAAPVGSTAAFFDVDWTVPVTDTPDTVELRLVVGESAGGGVPVRFDGGRVAAAGGFLVVLSDLFDAGRIYLTALWDAITAWLEDVFDPAAWTALKTDTDEAWAVFVRQVKRALHHADADLFHPPNTSDIIESALRNNPWFGWLTNLFDEWLQPVLKIGKVATEFGDSIWHAITEFAHEPTASGAWSTLMDAITAAWNAMVNAVLAAWDPDSDSGKTHEDFTDPVTAATEALRNNDWFGWLFDMVDSWLEPVLKIGKAVADFGEVVWHAISAFALAPGAPGAWSTMVSAIETAWDVFIRAVFVSWGATEEQANAKAEAMPSPADATKAAVKNNPVTGWLFGSSFDDAVESIINALGLGPVVEWFTRLINDLEVLFDIFHMKYTSAQWSAALTDLMTITIGDWAGTVVDPRTVSDANAVTGGSTSTSQANNDLVTGADASVPHAPTFGLLQGAVGFGAPAAQSVPYPGFLEPPIFLYYVVTAVKAGIESVPSAEKFVMVIAPGKVTITWTASKTTGVTYNVYRGTAPGKENIRIATGLTATTFTDSASSATTSATPSTTTARAGSAVATTAAGHQELLDTIVQVGTDTTNTGHTTSDVGSALANWPGEHVSGPDSVGMTANLTMSQTLDQLVSGLTAVAATGATPTDAGVAANDLNQRVNLAGTLAVMSLKENHAPVPWRDGGDSTADVTVPMVSATQLMRYPAGYAAGVLLTPALGGPKDQIQIGFIQRPTTLTDVRVALYQLQTDGLWHRVFVTPSSIATSIANNGTTADNNAATLVTIPLGATLQTAPGQAYYVEVINKNASTANASLLVANQLLRDPGWNLLPAYLRTDAATVTSPATLAWTSGTYYSASTLFYATLGYTGGANAVEGDETTPFETPGSFTWHAPAWWRPGVDYVDVVTLGSGASGGIGTGVGNNGNASSLVIPSGPGARTVAGAAGVRGATGTTSVGNSTGKSPGRLSFNNHLYLGGDQSSVVLGFSTSGKSPGGGSSGAYFGGLYGYGGGAGGWDHGTFQPNTTTLSGVVGAGGAGVNTGVWRSYDGGDGAVWITARQNRSA